MFEVEEWLHSRIGLNFRSGLGRIQEAVDLLGNPEKSYPIIHEGIIYGAWKESCDLYLPSYCLHQ